MMDQNKIIIVPDVHCRSFYKPVLKIEDKPIIFLGDYMDPYRYEGCIDEDGITNLEEIFDFARINPNVTLLCGNHDCSHIWSFLGWERTDYKYYEELHGLYRTHINLIHPCKKINNILFTHAGISNGWIKTINNIFEQKDSEFRINEDNVVNYIENEFFKELEHESAFGGVWDSYLFSNIFDCGRYRGGYAPYGGPLWNDIAGEYSDPEGWEIKQIFGHTQLEKTGSKATVGNGTCIDSRSIFELDLNNFTFETPFLNEED